MSQRLRAEVDVFPTHARTLRLLSSSIDGAVFRQESENSATETREPSFARRPSNSLRQLRT